MVLMDICSTDGPVAVAVDMGSPFCIPPSPRYSGERVGERG
jgi:hypothetical protein